MLSKENIEKLFSLVDEKKDYKLKVDLNLKEIMDDFGLKINFDIDEYRRYCLINGLDDI